MSILRLLAYQTFQNLENNSNINLAMSFMLLHNFEIQNCEYIWAIISNLSINLSFSLH